MPRFAANLSMMFAELPFMARFEAAAEAGFGGVEYLFPYTYSPEEIGTELKRLGLTQALFNAPPGDWDGGERGLAALPGREGEFQASFETALNYAEAIQPQCLHVMSGLVDPIGAAGQAAEAVLIDNLRHATARAAERHPGLTLTLEPINTRDMPGYFLNFTDQALRIIEAVAAENLKLQLDLYHCQIMEGDLAKKIEHLMPEIAHIQIAGIPDRHEPNAGEVNYPYLFDLIDRAGYEGWVGCEYRPAGKTTDGLAWFHAASAA